ncbi:beta-1,6-N-acetylglucosaminyltransferase [Microcoleus sp. ARI1-B5]|uniref:beta-1,6-N-acetylglucosaminyltransferase n=1 Tax=unclassified Microcoleus TaxID=2642155 RepID=UPI002FD5934F
MKIAYIVVAHKYPEQLLRLISKLNTDDVAFFVHIDKKVDNTIYHQIFTLLKDFPNVSFIKRYRSAWASFELVKATLEGIKSIVETGTYFDYVVNLSGQDYLIKSNEHIQSFLQENKGREFIDYVPLPGSKWGAAGLRRVEHWHIRWNDIYLFCIPPVKREFKSPIASLLYSVLIWPLPKKRKFFESFPLYGGSAHWCLTGECVKWIDDFVKQNTNFVNRFNYTSCADEIFYQTLILNSPFKDKIINDDLRYMDWPYVNAYHPRNLEKKDFEKIRESDKLFARKFDMTVDADILDMIDEMILSK